MSNAQKLKKTKKKGMSPEAKATLGNAFKGIISNQCCVDGGKEGPWWVAVIFLVLSIILPLIPIMTTLSKSHGAEKLSGTNYGLDRGIMNTFLEVKDGNYTFVVEGGNLCFYQNGDPATVDQDYTNPTPLASDDIEIEAGKRVYNFDLYVTDLKGGNLEQYVKNIQAKKYIVGTKIPGNPKQNPEDIQGDPEGTKYYTPSFLLLTSNTMAFGAYKSQTDVMATHSYEGLTWNQVPNGDLIERILGDEVSEANTIAHFRILLDQTYLDTKAIVFRNNTLIYFGVYAGLILFLGLMVFILTRGKKNMFHFLSFFKCQKITWWAAFTPALLGMIFAFIFSTNMIGQMSFVVFLALRIMWMSMRQLRPVQ